jgi:hypothetical protein
LISVAPPPSPLLCPHQPWPQNNYESPAWSPPSHLTSGAATASFPLLCKLLLLPSTTNIGHHFFHQCLLSHRLDLLTMATTPTLGNLPPFFFFFFFPCGCCIQNSFVHAAAN